MKNIIYFNCNSVSEGENPAIYVANSQQPICSESGSYTMCIVRASFDRAKIPVFIPKMQYANANPLLTAYQYKIIASVNNTSYNQTGTIQFANSYGLTAPTTSPVDQRSVIRNPFYWTYDLNEFINMFNTSMATTWASLQTAAGAYDILTKPPILVLNDNLFTIYFDNSGFSYDNAHGGANENFTISFNTDLKYLLDNLNFSYQTSNANLFPYVLNFAGVTTTYANPITTKTYLALTQLYRSLSLFSPIENVVFMSDVGDYKTDQIGTVNILGSGSAPPMSNSIESQITDIDLDIDNPMDWTNMVLYNPTQYREINIDNTMNINKIKIRLQWKSRYGDYFDIILKDGSSLNLKIRFMSE